MRTRTMTPFLALVFVAGMAGLVAAADQPVTVSGKLACAHCTLNKADMTHCQDMLVTTASTSGGTNEYYIVKNATLEKFGHTCRGEKSVTVTGTVMAKDGKMWLTPTRIEAQES